MYELEKLIGLLDILNIKTKDVDYNDRKTFVDNLEITIKNYVTKNINNFILSYEDIEGESKKIYKDTKSDICLTRLKPTLYSYTYNRYDTVLGTDDLRYEFWDLFAKFINNVTYNFVINGTIKCNKRIYDLLSKITFDNNYPFLNSYLGSVIINDKKYVICRYIKNQTPLEVVWKNRLVGTMKHSLLNVDKWCTKFGESIKYEGGLPEEIVRFDWRNPCWFNNERYKDECIPDDFANFYTDVQNAKNVCKVVSNIIDFMLNKAGYKFIDTCYFINSTGNIIYSEITPDGMRIQKINDNDSRFDKDLWRQGKDKDTILRVWGNLLNDLEKIVKKEKKCL